MFQVCGTYKASILGKFINKKIYDQYWFFIIYVTIR